MRRNKNGTLVWSNLTFNTNTGLGHSYRWYEIAKRVNGKQLLNTYKYSPTTGRHWRKLLDHIDPAYIEVEAPNGLQDLKGALNHCMQQRTEIEALMATKKNKDTMVYFVLQQNQYKYNMMIHSLLSLGV